MENNYVLECEIEKGAFSGEKVFKIKLESGDYVSLASYRNCFNQNNEPLNKHEPISGEIIKGKIEARVLDDKDIKNILVSIPDGEVIRVNRDELFERPKRVGVLEHDNLINI